MTEAISYSRRVAELAALHPEQTAVVLVAADGSERRIAWATLDAEASRTARLLAEHGVDENWLVIVALPTSLEHFLAIVGAWRLGACVLPLNPAIPAAELAQLLEVATAWRPAIVLGDVPAPGGPAITQAALAARAQLGDGALPDRVPHPGKAIASGGSTGRPRIILDPNPWLKTPGRGMLIDLFGVHPGQTQLITTRLYHNIAFNLWSNGLIEDQMLVVMEQFDAARTIDLIERYRIGFMGIVPTVMQRIIRQPDVRRRDFSSVEALYHSGGPCPPWLKRVWMELVPPERQWDLYGSAEAIGFTLIRGDEWLRHPGSVGRPWGCRVRVLDEHGRDLPPGEVGEIFMRRFDLSRPAYEYLGALPARTTDDGFTSVGDLGWLDDEGYLYLADRRVDLIITGGANVYPAEVEAALSEHPEVADVAVVGRPDANWGKRVHALVQPSDPARPPSPEALDRHARARLQPYKVPRSYDFVPQLPRDENGKIRRSALAQDAQ